MRVFLLKDVERIGLAGEVVQVKEGFGKNFLIPRKLGVELTPQNEKHFKHRIKDIAHRKEVIASKTSMLAEKIRGTKLRIKRKTHDDGKLFGSVSPNEIVDALSEKGVSVSKSQVDFGKSIKSTGEFQVTIKLSSKLKPELSVTVVSEGA